MTNLQGFGRSFRRSNLLSSIDDYSEAILNSRMDIKLQQRFTPTLGTSAAYTLNFPVGLAAPDDVNHTVTSNSFTIDGSICNIRNELKSTVLQVVDADGNIVLNNIGNYVTTTGVVTITGFAPATLTGGQTTINISATPASQSTVRPLRNYILDIDTNKSFSSGTVDYDITQVAL